MSENAKPDWTTTDDELRTDPDMPEQPDEQDGPASAFPTADDTPVGETERIREDKQAYSGPPAGSHTDHGHAVGGSEGTADGQ